MKSVADGLTTLALEVTCERAEGARHAEGRRPCLSVPAARPHHPAARRSGRRVGARHDRGRAGRGRRRRRRRRRAGARARRRLQPRRRRRGLRRHGRRGRDPRHRRRRRRRRRPVVRRRDGHGRGGRVLGRPRRHGRRARLDRRRGALRHPRARSARPRSRTSAPTARRSPRPSPGCGCGTASLRGVRTFATADCGFGYRTSRFKADPGRHVVLDVTFQLRQGDLGAPVALRRAGPHASASPRASAPRWPTSARRCSACAAARAWCSTPPTTTRGAPARSSPTRSSTPERPPRCPTARRAGRSPTARSRRAPPG